MAVSWGRVRTLLPVVPGDGRPRADVPMLMNWLSNLAYGIAAIIYLPVLTYQMIVQRKNRHGWGQRLGHIAPRNGDRPCVWVHAVSLGEVNATRTLIAALRGTRGDIDIVVSTTTDTGHARAHQLYPDLHVFRFPLDFSWVIRRVLTRIRPNVIVLMELELWYNLVTLAARQRIAVCIANGRFTERSSRRLGHLGFLVRPMFAALEWVGAQNDAIAERFERHGVPRDHIEVVGSMKWDTAAIQSHIDGADELRHSLGLNGARGLVVMGSSGPGEEALMLDAWLARCAEMADLVVVPRKPERFNDVAALIERRGVQCIRRSAVQAGRSPMNDGRARVYLGDTMGELRKFYSLADVIIIGRTFVPLGGSDPMEAAALGKPIIVGPHTENFADPVARLVDGGALRVTQSVAAAVEVAAEWLADAPLRGSMGIEGQTVVRENQGATECTVQRIARIVPQ